MCVTIDLNAAHATTHGSTISARGFNDGSTVSPQGFNVDAANVTAHGTTVLAVAANGGNRDAPLPLSSNCIQPRRIQPQRNVRDSYVADKLAMAPPSPQRKKLKVSNNLKEQLTAELENMLVKAAASLAALEKLLAKKEQLTAALKMIPTVNTPPIIPV
jgi:hypothetical protein